MTERHSVSSLSKDLTSVTFDQSRTHRASTASPYLQLPASLSKHWSPSIRGALIRRTPARRCSGIFFARDTALKVLAGGNDWFYKDIRCGILHQSESRGGWRVLRSGPLLNAQAKTINATAILRALRWDVRRYAQKIQTDEQLWKNFCKKMGTVCANCY